MTMAIWIVVFLQSDAKKRHFASSMQNTRLYYMIYGK